MIKITSTSYSATAEGSTTMEGKKTGRVVTISTNGISKESSTRSMRTYNITITNMDQANYDELMDMFLYDNDFVIEDTNRNFEVGNFFIDSDSFKLQDNEDKKEKGYYYTGAIPIKRA